MNRANYHRAMVLAEEYRELVERGDAVAVSATKSLALHGALTAVALSLLIIAQPSVSSLQPAVGRELRAVETRTQSHLDQVLNDSADGHVEALLLEETGRTDIVYVTCFSPSICLSNVMGL